MKKILFSMSLAAIMFSGCGIIQTASGEKIGQIVKVNEQSGLLNKTMEVEIMKGGFNNGTGVNGNSLHFTVENRELMEELKTAMDNGDEVKVYYKEYMIGFFSSDSNNVFVNQVEVLHHRPVQVTQSMVSQDATPNSEMNTAKTVNDYQNKIDGKSNKEILLMLQSQHNMLLIQNEVLQTLLKK
jgi:hypothetical protein